MPFLEVPNHRIHYALTGPADARVLVLSNSLGTDFSMWDSQLSEFEKHFRVLRYDTRGHGQSAVPHGSYTFHQLGGDVVALLDALEIERADFCGLSMGGMTGLWLGLNTPQRLHKSVISNASARFGTVEGWNTRIETVRRKGMKAVAAHVVERWYTPEFRASSPGTASATLQMLEATSPEGYIGCCAALRDTDLRESVVAIRTPTLIISGAKDPVSAPADGKYLAAQIPGAQYLELDAAHLSNVEASDAYTSAVLHFLNSEGA
jgi:3-oxoadipate enol-lactonase